MPPRSNSLDSFDFAMCHQACPTMSYILLVLVSVGSQVTSTDNNLMLTSCMNIKTPYNVGTPNGIYTSIGCRPGVLLTFVL